MDNHDLMMRNDENLSDDRRIPTVLPKRRKDHEPSDIGSGSSISSSRQASLSSERKWMDRNPRDIRLSNRMGSPLGMTLEVVNIASLYVGSLRQLQVQF